MNNILFFPLLVTFYKFMFSRPLSGELFGLFDRGNVSRKRVREEEQVYEKVAEVLIESILKEKRSKKKVKKRRKKKPLPDYDNSVWGQMLRDPDVEDMTTKTGKLFRRRFRIPYVLFRDILVPQCREANVFEGRGRAKIPLELKILIALRILGRDGIADDCQELSLVDESTCTEIFKKLVRNYSGHYYSTFVKVP